MWHKRIRPSHESRRDYGDVFEGLGNMPGEYDIELDPSVKPVQHLPRRVPKAMKEDIRVKFDELTKRGIVTKVSGSTDWINSMVVVKEGTKLRICIDPKELNQAIKRPHCPMPVLDDILPKLVDANVFTVQVLKEGFWHVNLSEKSSYLTTFWTPFGRYHWLLCLSVSRLLWRYFNAANTKRLKASKTPKAWSMTFSCMAKAKLST